MCVFSIRHLLFNRVTGKDLTFYDLCCHEFNMRNDNLWLNLHDEVLQILIQAF